MCIRDSFPIVWIVFTAIALYQVTVVSGRFEDLRAVFNLSLIHI